VITNKTILQQAGQQRAMEVAAFQKTLFSTAQQKGWPLTIRGKKGRMAYLRGINTRGLPVYITTTDNIISAATIRTSQLWPGGGTGLGLNGSSSNLKGRIAVWDEGIVRPTHVELAGRVTQVDAPSALSDHSTHVSGTMIAAGVNPLARGMSFGAQQLLAYDFYNDQAEMMTAAAKGLLVSNHSYANIAGWNFNGQFNRWEFWGQPGDTVDISFGLYDQDAQVWDSIAYNAPQYLIFKAAGNNRGERGPQVGQTYYRMNANGTFINAGQRPAGISSNDSYNTIATYGCSKNILTIGAVNAIPGGYSKPSDVVMTDFSSWGPTGDGRIKPDLVADGVNVLSSISTTDNAYDIFSGTSMATPASAGSSFLLQEYYTKLHGASKYLRSATVKGLLIHTADEAGPAPGPDYQFGWGLINMQKAAAVITSDNTDHSQQILENQLIQGSHDKDTVTIIASGKAPLLATICWTDPPGIPPTIPANEQNFADTSIKLINDLDLRIVDSNTSKVFLPWILNPSNRQAAATKGDNILDNAERVELSDTLVPGHTYKIAVSHKRTLARGSQAYSLLISGGGGTAYCNSSSLAGGASIDKITVSNLTQTNATGTCRSYTDLTGQPAAQLPVGGTVPVSIVHSSCNGSGSTRVISIYIDYNNNGVFETGELAAQSAAVSPGTFSGSITVPATVTAGARTRMRIIAEETANPASVSPCNSYANGETQDYQVVFTNPVNDAGVTGLEYPGVTTCASDSQIVAIRIRNFGSVPQTSVPVSTVIKDGSNNTVATLSAICKDSIAVGADVVFTYNTTFHSVAGKTYTFTSATALAGDLNTGNDQNITTFTVTSTGTTLSGTAILCSQDATQALLKTTVSGNDIATWFPDSTTSTTLGIGDSVTTTVVPSNKTWYLQANDLLTKAGPPNKIALAGGRGAYFRLGGNFIRFTTSVPLTIESAKMYFGHSGKMSFTLATLASFSATGGYSYYPLYNTTIDVAATAANPDTSRQVNVSAGDNSDTGAVYYLNIPVPVPGNYILILECSNYANAFLNVYSGSSTSTLAPYPFTLPGIISITGNDMQYNPSNTSDSVNYFKHFYYPFYNLGVRVTGCPGPRVAVPATIPTQPAITLNGNVINSSYANGNQWYRNGLKDSLDAVTNGQTLQVKYPGVYQTIVTDPASNCVIKSNVISYLPAGASDLDGNSIALTVTPNPNNGVFQLGFYFATPDNTTITLTSTLGQHLYTANYPNFSGQFSQQIQVPNLASGMYVLEIMHGGTKYLKRILVKR